TAPVIDALGAPAKLQRKIWQEAPAPELYFWRPLHRCALALDKVLIKSIVSLEKCIAPISKHTEIGFAEAAAPDIRFYIAGQIASIDQFAREQRIRISGNVAEREPIVPCNISMTTDNIPAVLGNMRTRNSLIDDVTIRIFSPCFVEIRAFNSKIRIPVHSGSQLTEKTVPGAGLEVKADRRIRALRNRPVKGL